MKPEEINIAIAVACGWRYAGPMEAKPVANACWYAPGDMEWHQQLLPDYCNDLNAMAEARKSISPTKRSQYLWALRKVTNDGFGNRDWPSVNANARQHAEAFLRTIGKWREDQ